MDTVKILPVALEIVLILADPFTSNFSVGAVVPIPTLPLAAILIFSVGAALLVEVRNARAPL